VKLIQLSRTDRTLVGILLVLALLAALITWLAMPPKKEGRLVREPSSFFNTGSGTKAIYLVLERLGYNVTRLRVPMSKEVLAEFDALFILEPVVGLEKSERLPLERWVESGHRLVIAPGVRMFGATPGVWLFDNWFNIGPPTNAVTAGDGKIKQVRGDSLRESDPLFDGVRELVARGDFRFPLTGALKGPLATANAQPIWVDDYGVVALRVPFGNGEIIALADTYCLSNQGIDEADNAIFLANLAREVTGGDRASTIAFDEIHHGFALADDPWVAMVKMMLAEYWGWGIIQATVVLLLALYAAGVRFGKPVDIVQKPRRQHGEFAEAAGRTLHDANAGVLAFRTLFAHYRAALAKLVHLAPDASSAELGHAIGVRTGLQITPLLEEMEAKLAADRVARVEVLDMATEFQRVLDVIGETHQRGRPALTTAWRGRGQAVQSSTRPD
jgi:uncharacterized membrane protein